MRSLFPYEIERNALALRIGTDLPNPRNLSVPKPGFAVGSCERLHFSPDGLHLIAVTANGTFLWDVATGTRARKLIVPSNPTEVVFSSGGEQALVRNEQGQFVRLSLPDGDVLAKFKAKYRYRLDGTPGLGPNDRILQLAYEGRLLEIDGSTGEVRHEFQLEATGYSGEVHCFPRVGCWIVAQRSLDNGQGQSVPCALWRWDFDALKPHRLPGQWDQLVTSRVPGEDAVLLHHVVARGRPDLCVVERHDLIDAATKRIGEAPGSILPSPSIAHDGRAFGVAGDNEAYIDVGGEILRLPGRAYVQFNPTHDLVAITGRASFVAPRAKLLEQLPALNVWHLERELGGRGHARLSALGGNLPPRLVVFARERDWLIQAEIGGGRWYAPLAASSVVSETNVQELCIAFDAARERAVVGPSDVEPGTPNEKRSFHGGTITPPGPGWRSAVAIAFAPDAIDLWPLKPSGAVAFAHECYPLAALPTHITTLELISAVRKMLAWFKPRSKV